MITDSDMLTYAHRGFNLSDGTTNKKLLNVYKKTINFYDFNLLDETVKLRQRELSGNHNLALDNIGRVMGVPRRGLSNNEYRHVLNALALRGKTSLLKVFSQISDLFVGFEWIKTYQLVVGFDSGVLLIGNRKLKGLNKLLGGKRVKGKFIPNVSGRNKLLAVLEGLNESRLENMKSIYKHILPIGYRLEVRDGT